MNLIIVNEEAFKKLLAEKTAEGVSLLTLADSLHAAQLRFEQARANRLNASLLYHEALTLLDTESDDWQIARAAQERLDEIEQNYIDAGRIYNAALNRLGFEIREAEKKGIK